MREITKEKANELDGKTWMKYSISVWNDIKKSKEERELRHPAIYPKALVKRLIECFMKKSDKVLLDPFVGVGSSVLAGVEEGKFSIGIDIVPEYIKIAENRLKQNFIFYNEIKYRLICEDAFNLLKYIGENSVDFCVTSPPYWDILNRKRTADGKEIKSYIENPSDFTKLNNYEEYINKLSSLFILMSKVLKKNNYFVLNVMDLRKENKFYPVHIDIVKSLKDFYYLDDIIIWDRRNEYSNLRPIGYPYKFRVNKIHEFLLVFINIK